MAASGYTPIQLYYSATPTSAPLAVDLIAGELAINTADGKLYYKDSAGNVQTIASKAGNVNVSSISFASTGLTPATASTGDVVVAGTLATTNGGTGRTSFSANQVLFAATTSTVNQSADLTWNGTTFGVTGVLTVSGNSSFTSTGALLISKGTTVQQPGSPVTGMLRYNTTSNEFEGYAGSPAGWKSVGGSAIINDTTTATDLYPTFVNATSGTALSIYTSDAKLLYKPSTGEFQSSQVVASNGFLVNGDNVATNYTVGSGFNAVSVGPMTVDSGVTVTVSSGQRWVVL